ncbi:hypothetical protein RQP46_004963 [Phenoliferia psychrophenolica]
MAATELYIANDDDYEYDQNGNLVPVATGEAYDEDEEEGDWGEDGDLGGSWEAAGPSKAPKPAPAKAERIPSDVPDEAYWDDSALVRCWTAALVDFKYYHPSRFAPLVEAPRTPRQKSAAAPLWFGSFEPPKSKQSTSGKTASPAPATTKSKKRRAKDRTKERETDAKRVKLDAPLSPRWQPKSPEFQRAASPSTEPALAPVPPPPSRRPIVGPVLPTPAAFSPPIVRALIASAPRSYPAPPPIAPIAPVEPSDEPAATPEELLQDALWSWYNAGYQTALYHASLATPKEAE